MTVAYYRALFGGALGFEQAADFTSYPSLGPLSFDDGLAEEQFTVYDHPRVLLFKKTPAFSLARGPRDPAGGDAVDARRRSSSGRSGRGRAGKRPARSSRRTSARPPARESLPPLADREMGSIAAALLWYVGAGARRPRGAAPDLARLLAPAGSGSRIRARRRPRGGDVRPELLGREGRRVERTAGGASARCCSSPQPARRSSSGGAPRSSPSCGRTGARCWQGEAVFAVGFVLFVAAARLQSGDHLGREADGLLDPQHPRPDAHAPRVRPLVRGRAARLLHVRPGDRRVSDAPDRASRRGTRSTSRSGCSAARFSRARSA